MPQRIHVRFILDHAASAADDRSIGRAQPGGRVALTLAEAFLALFGEDLWDGSARRLDDDIIHIDVAFSASRSRQRGDARLSGARHADEHDVAALGDQTAIDLIDHLIVHRLVQKVLHGLLCLGHQHFQAVDMHEPSLAGLLA